MRQTKYQKATALFLAIGTVEDRYLAEALAPRIKRQPMRRALLIAACLTLSTVVLLGVLLIALQNRSLPDGSTQPPIENPQTQPTTPTNPLDLLLVNHSTEQNALEEDALDFFSKNARVVWRYADSPTLYTSRALSDGELERLLNRLKTAKPTEESDTKPSCEVWILLGDGSVISPYLHTSPGNTAAAELFDYNVEVIPDADFAACLSDILN